MLKPMLTYFNWYDIAIFFNGIYISNFVSALII